MSTIRTLISKPLDPITAFIDEKVLAEFFGPDYRHGVASDDVEEFLSYYNKEVGRLEYGLVADTQMAKLALKTHEDVVETVKVLRTHTSSRRPAVRSALESIFRDASEDELNRAIDLTLRLWLTINVREKKFKGLADPIRPAWQWNDETELRDFLYSLFPLPRWELTAREGRHDPNFNIAFMIKICGLKHKWTPSLEDHLRFNRKTKTLWIFKNKRYLQLMMKDNKNLGPEDKPLIPPKVLQETIDSLLLLFPSPDEATENLLKPEGSCFYEVPPFEPMRPLGISDFTFWKDRLLELYQEVYQVQTPGWNQLRKDQRNPQQWLAFWLGLVIALLTLFSAITGLVSTIASVYQAWYAGPPVCNCDASVADRLESYISRCMSEVKL